MIEDNIRGILQSRIDNDINWSINYATLKDDIVTVYNSGGSKPSTYEGRLYNPNYQIIVKSSDFDKATSIADQIFTILHKYSNDKITVDYSNREVDYKIYFIEALHTPILIGVNDDEVMEYSLNFTTHILKLEERLK